MPRRAAFVVFVEVDIEIVFLVADVPGCCPRFGMGGKMEEDDIDLFHAGDVDAVEAAFEVQHLAVQYDVQRILIEILEFLGIVGYAADDFVEHIHFQPFFHINDQKAGVEVDVIGQAQRMIALFSQLFQIRHSSEHISLQVHVEHFISLIEADDIGIDVDQLLYVFQDHRQDEAEVRRQRQMRLSRQSVQAFAVHFKDGDVDRVFKCEFFKLDRIDIRKACRHDVEREIVRRIVDADGSYRGSSTAGIVVVDAIGNVDAVFFIMIVIFDGVFD